MNLDNQPLSTSELIYTYLDGEATPVEQSILFGALASNSELQQEFNEAIEMRKAFAFDSSSAVPPDYLTARVFESNGVATAVATTGIASIAVAVLPFVKKFIAPIAFSTLGAGLMYLGLSYYSNQEVAPLITQKAQTSAAVSQPTHSALSHSAVSPNATTRMEKTFGSTQQQRVASQSVRASLRDNANQNILQQRAEQSAWGTAEEQPGFTSEQALLSASSYLQNGTTSAWGSQHPRATEFSSEGLFSLPQETSITLQLQNVVESRAYPSSSSTSPTLAAARAPQITALYNATERYSVGASVARKSFQYAAGSGSDLVVNPTLWCVGATAQYTEPDYSVLGATPVVQLSVGYAFSGGYFGETLMGVTAPLYQQFSLLAGIQGNMLVYSNNSITQAAGNVGLSAGFTLQF